jgi:hypothetical protein
MDTGMLRDTLRTKMGTLCALFSMRANDPSFIRLTVLTGMVASLALMSAKVLLYRALLAIRGGPGKGLGTAGLLVLYGFLVQWATRSDRF